MSSEAEAEGGLDISGQIFLGVDAAKRRGAEGAGGGVEADGVEDVEELGAELESGLFGDGEVLEQ